MSGEHRTFGGASSINAHSMSADLIRQRLPALLGKDGKVDQQQLDALMLEARDAGGLDAAERAELMLAADSFDDAAKQRLLSHLSALGQKNAFVNVEARS